MKTVETTLKPEEHTITVLEDMLEDAKKGEIIGMVYATIHGDGKCAYGRVGKLDLQPNRLTGAISNSLLDYQLNHVLEWIPND